MKKSQEGFTLIEVTVVMAIIAVLAVLIVAAITAARRSSVEVQNRSNVKTYETAQEAFAGRNSGRYATNTGNLNTVLTTAPLNTFVPNYRPGSCANGGGNVTAATTSTFTVTVLDWQCANVIDTITR